MLVGERATAQEVCCVCACVRARTCVGRAQIVFLKYLLLFLSVYTCLCACAGAFAYDCLPVGLEVSFGLFFTLFFKMESLILSGNSLIQLDWLSN